MVKQPDARSDELPGDVGPLFLHHGGPQHDCPHWSDLRLNWDEHVSGGAKSPAAPLWIKSILMDCPLAMGLFPVPALLGRLHRGFRQMEKLLMGFYKYWHKDSLRKGSGFMAGLSPPG